MKTRFLLPHQLRLVGWLFALPGFVLGYFVLYSDFRIPGFGISLSPNSHFFPNPQYEDLTNELALILVVVGLFLVAFSKEKKEDELTARIRQNALYWAVLVNYLLYLLWLLLVITIELSGRNKLVLGHLGDPLEVSIYNLFTPLVIFVARYYYLRHSKNDEYKISRLFYLPEKPYRLLGQITSIPLLIAIVIMFVGPFINKNDVDIPGGWDVIIMFLPVTLLIWGYSRRKNEDEFISTLRLESMQLAVYVNYAVLMIANLFLFFTDFILVLFLNLGTIALFFVLRFNYILWTYNRKNMGGNLAL